MNKLYHIMTFGCQMNEHDSEIMAGMLEEMGYSETQKRAEADIILINTCSIRENADKRFFGSLGQLKRLHREKPEMIVGVCGCMMQQQHIIDAIRKKYSWVDLVFGTHNIHELPELITKILNDRQKVVSVWSEHRGIFEGLPSKRRYPFKAFVNITYGCNNFCTYCIVPYTRGRERSRLPEDILKEVRELAADGVKEVMLLGQNVNSYGLADGFEMDFADLIYAINEIEGIERIRFMTSHPKDLSDKLIGAYRDCEKLACHIHLPVQAGSNRVLKRMNRKYTRESYLELIRKLREA
ncbi:MAG: tRNA (N6-isopentenyl adenosine(37)-C2)-methylthiotransferase MiaB, partial [Firmicutes bacterium]|nr:tRNA (N6-isopentenyl adenosine(37)-C2)-methylthiotransferase MiaB [Bacillota bacterium]